MSIQVTWPSPVEAQLLVTEWQAEVARFQREIQTWVQEAHGAEWEINLSSSGAEEEALGSYEIPVMEINTAEGRLVLEPVARYVIGARGRIDFYAWPSLFRVMLLRRSMNEQWVIRTDSGINWPAEWSKETFFLLAESLLKA